MRILQYSLAFVFLVFGVVQFNDPDPEWWVSWYFGLSLLCVLDALGRMSRWMWMLPVVLGTVWLISIWPEAWEGLGLGEGLQMKNDNIERARESGGLLISILASYAFFRWRRTHMVIEPTPPPR
ncbi:MAG: transmembrane 220 family protein [Bacteroidota bacterium]|jgi:hypothetical protein